jgi:protease YdgD
MMIRVPLQMLAGLAIIFAVQSALSQDLRPGIIGNDDRVRLDERGPPWDAVGQVNVAGYRTGFDCTGTLIAPTLVVTAAHCVINPIAQKPYALKDIHFLAAVRGPENKGHATAQCLHFLPSYRSLPLEKSSPRLGAECPSMRLRTTWSSSFSPAHSTSNPRSWMNMPIRSPGCS